MFMFLLLWLLCLKNIIECWLICSRTTHIMEDENENGPWRELCSEWCAQVSEKHREAVHKQLKALRAAQHQHRWIFEMLRFLRAFRDPFSARRVLGCIDADFCNSH